ncbi:MAG: hypothetical protein A2169_05520 [Deltaproteobacteria bacterium RBG_13_47_9]|nr:MAG: hypothetical protein A2169_05520 [Deltaproteobacteria bacterium RBG_13_47_9]
MNRALLEKPFEPSQIKQRQGNFGHILDYVEGHVVTSRLNEAFDGNWSFEVVKYRILKDTDEVLVLGKLTAEGVTKMAFGSKEIERTKDTKAIFSLGDDLKAASTDALKKAASLLGVGLYLYSDQRPNGKTEEGRPETPNKGASTGNEKNQPGPKDEPATGDGNGGRLTNKQLAMIFGVGKSKGLQTKDIKDKALATFKKNLNFLTKEEASTFINALQSM